MRTTITLLVLLLSGSPAMAADATPIDLGLLQHGQAAFPAIWKPYREIPLPPVHLTNGPRLDRMIADGRLSVSLNEFLQLVVENDLELHAARYDDAIAAVDVLRARSGQAARGLTGAPLPPGLFAGALGAGEGGGVGLSLGGTGGAAIASQGQLVSLGPRGTFDPTVTVNWSYDHLVNPLDTAVVAGQRAVDVDSTVLLTAYQQELPSGTSFAVSFNLQRQSSSQANLLFNPALTSFGSLMVYQPLLNGFGRAATQRFLTVARLNRQIVHQQFAATLNRILAQAADAYWELVALSENVRVAQDVVATDQQQVTDDQKRVAAGAMIPLDTLPAQTQLATARVQLVVAETARQEQQEQLKMYVSRTIDAKLAAATIVPTDPLPSEPVEIPSIQATVAETLSTNPAIQSAALSLRNRHIAEEYTRTSLLPVLSVFGMANAYGLAPDTTPAMRQLVRATYPEYAVGLSCSFPVFNRAAQADNLRARLEAQQAEVQLQQLQRQAPFQARSSAVTIRDSWARVEAARRGIEAAQTTYAGEQKRLRVGASTPYRVALAERDLLTAQSAEIQARVDYVKAIVAREAAVGTLPAHHGIDVDLAERDSFMTESGGARPGGE